MRTICIQYVSSWWSISPKTHKERSEMCDDAKRNTSIVSGVSPHTFLLKQQQQQHNNRTLIHAFPACTFSHPVTTVQC